MSILHILSQNLSNKIHILNICFLPRFYILFCTNIYSQYISRSFILILVNFWLMHFSVNFRLNFCSIFQYFYAKNSGFTYEKNKQNILPLFFDRYYFIVNLQLYFFFNISIEFTDPVYKLSFMQNLFYILQLTDNL